eukprot:6200336-Pleurochrysis_carterae.AAC.1
MDNAEASISRHASIGAHPGLREAKKNISSPSALAIVMQSFQSEGKWQQPSRMTKQLAHSSSV